MVSSPPRYSESIYCGGGDGECKCGGVWGGGLRVVNSGGFKGGVGSAVRGSV